MSLEIRFDQKTNSYYTYGELDMKIGPTTISHNNITTIFFNFSYIAEIKDNENTKLQEGLDLLTEEFTNQFKRFIQKKIPIRYV